MSKKEIVIESLYIYQRLNDKVRADIVRKVVGKQYMETKYSKKKFEELYSLLSAEMRMSGLNPIADTKIFFQGSNLDFYLERL